MARPLRIEEADMWYHVMCRGNAKQRVFVDERDYDAFVTRLGTLAIEMNVEIHAYVLMNNHLHIFIRTRTPNLSRFMQRLLTGYTQWFNTRHERCGHLFQGRYKALVVDRDAYGAAVSRYIHLNPVRVPQARRWTVDELRTRLRTYPWSSYPAMIGAAKAPPWLRTEATLASRGRTLRAQQHDYREFVESGLTDHISDPAEAAVAQSVLGAAAFVERIRREMERQPQRDKDSATARRRLASDDLDAVLNRVARVNDTTVDALRLATRGRRRDEARQMALWLARECCTGTMSAREIGAQMGGISGAAVMIAHRRVRAKLHTDAALRRTAERLRQQAVDAASNVIC